MSMPGKDASSSPGIKKIEKINLNMFPQKRNYLQKIQQLQNGMVDCSRNITQPAAVSSKMPTSMEDDLQIHSNMMQSSNGEYGIETQLTYGK